MARPGGSAVITTRKATPLKAILVIQQFGFMGELCQHVQSSPAGRTPLNRPCQPVPSPLPPNRTLVGWIFRWSGRRAWDLGLRPIPPRLILAADCGPSSVCYTRHAGGVQRQLAADCGPSSVCYTQRERGETIGKAADCGPSSVCYTSPAGLPGSAAAADCGPSSVCYTQVLAGEFHVGAADCGPSSVCYTRGPI